MRVEDTLIPYIIESWQRNPKENPEGFSLEKMIELHTERLKRCDLPEWLVAELHRNALKLMGEHVVA